jgi:hypothetical protein
MANGKTVNHQVMAFIRPTILSISGNLERVLSTAKLQSSLVRESSMKVDSPTVIARVGASSFPPKTIIMKETIKQA